MGEVVALRLAEERESEPRTQKKTAMPAQFSAAEAERLLTWALVQNYSAEELRFAVESVRDWAETCAQRRCNWPKVVMNAMRKGWALRGFKRFSETTGSINPRTGTRIVKRTPITEEYIAAYLAWLSKRGDA